jgi:hypothetical protein
MPLALADRTMGAPEKGKYRKEEKRDGSFESKRDGEIIPPTMAAIHSQETGGMTYVGMM